MSRMHKTGLEAPAGLTIEAIEISDGHFPGLLVQFFEQLPIAWTVFGVS